MDIVLVLPLALLEQQKRKPPERSYHVFTIFGVRHLCFMAGLTILSSAAQPTFRTGFGRALTAKTFFYKQTQIYCGIKWK